ncbi:MAG: hypothetical protein ACRDP1_03245 [Nocardioidaceae bacterium]
MTAWLAWLIGAAGLVVAAWAALALLRSKPVDNALFYLCAAVETGLLAMLVGGFVALGNTSRRVDGVTFGAYLVTLVLVLPAAVVWGASDRTRWGTGVVVIGGLVVAVLGARLLQIWDAPVG